ncbi:energy transducer TonB [Roseivirga pacifica]
MRASNLVLICFFLTIGLQAQESVEEVTSLSTRAQYPGGSKAFAKFLQDNLKYPEEAKDQNIAGKVILMFDVEKDGSITNVKVIRSANPLLDTEAIRIVKTMPKWTPATFKGQAIKSIARVPINFVLN